MVSEEEQRELHHFETEKSLTYIYRYVKRLEDWEAQDYVIQNILDMIPKDIKDNK